MPEFRFFGFRAPFFFLLYFQNISHPFAQNSSASLTQTHHYHPDQEYASAQQLYSNNCNGDFMSLPQQQHQLLVSAHSCETTTLMHDRDVNGGSGGVLYNHNLRYNESYVLNGSSCSNHLNSSLSASQSSLPPPPTPSDLDDMMMVMMGGSPPQQHLHNASNHHESAENIYNTAAATNHNSHLYYDPRQALDRMMVTRGVQLNGDSSPAGVGCVDVQDGELETVSTTRLIGDDEEPLCFLFIVIIIQII